MMESSQVAQLQPVPVLDLSPEIEELWDEFADAFERVARSGRFILGPEVQSFEQECAQFLGVQHAIGVNSGTDAIVIGLRALGVECGDEVITTPFSFFATAEGISNVGATPVFVDIEEDTFNIDPALIEAAITSTTKAIMPVHLFGRPSNLDAITDLAKRHGLLVLEDCAQSFGASWNGQKTGSIGHAGAFSFFPTKNLGGFGDGGLITTNDDGVADLARMLRAHGGKNKYHNEILGYNSRLDALQAALLRVKLPHIDRFNEGRRRVASRYSEMLADAAGAITPEIGEGHVFHQYTIRVLDGRRDHVRSALAEQQIGSMVYYPVPQDKLPVYENLETNPCPVSDQLATEVLSLPIWPTLSNETTERVATAVRSALN
jgi:dTDP-4-amino-4,6-dideoxygalactose transaminase